MRTTVKLDDDVAAAVERMRAEQSLGFSEAVNRLARAGAAAVMDAPARKPFVQPTFRAELLVDISNVAEVLEMLEAQDDR